MTELTSLKGIGEKTAGAFNRLGIFSAEDLIGYYPRSYEEFAPPAAIGALTPGQTGTVEGVLQKAASVNRFGGMTIVNAYLSDMTGRLQLSWYNLPYIRQTLVPGAHYIFRGRIYEKNGRRIMAQPKLYRLQDYHEKYEGRLMPVYGLVKGLHQKTVMNAAAEALARTALLPAEYLPAEKLSLHGMLPLPEAVLRMHFPKNRAQLLAARRRICFDEFFLFLLTAAKIREETSAAVSVYRCRPQLDVIRFIADLPFELTKAQRAAWNDISRDMISGRVMNRLVEGDVGSGKTIVAVLAMLFAALNGYQAALMAPTEVLAVQHYETVQKLLEASGIQLRIVLLTGSMTAAQKRERYAAVKDHEADLIIGTHALFQEGVVYDRLGLVVTDEQHRFGVAQREALREKGELPHTLVMSATPIPRTLAIILYGDLDISVIDAMPGGRIPIKNCVVGTDYRATAYRFIAGEIKKGHQAYIICPAIEPEEDEEEDGASAFYGSASLDGADAEPLENVSEYTEKLRRLFPAEVRIDSLHGRMKPAEKDAVMQRFKAHETDLLIATTVVEVGVDVPNATVMMIENADRYGLAQLHQLRGRVGRGTAQSYCIMINTSHSAKAKERLSILNQSNDGFYIASEDLKLRGPGDLFGMRQSGDLLFATADIYQDAPLLEEAKEAVNCLLDEDSTLSLPEHAGLKERLAGYQKTGYIV